MPDPVRIADDPRVIGPLQSVRFRVRVDGIEQEAFVVRWKGGLHAFLNRCRHQHLPLDFGDGHFFDEEADALVCCHHGARYRPDTGACIGGPCAGGTLTGLALEERDGALWCVGLRPASAGGTG